jgi:hypothetical protein
MKNYFLLFPLTFLLACNKAPLDAPFSQVYGEFEWKETSYRADPWSSLQYLYAAGYSFSAKAIFSDDNTVKFFINNEQVASSKFKPLSKTQNGNDIVMRLRVNFKGDLDFERDITVSMIGADSMFIDAFPFNSYQPINANSWSNMFLRQ